MITLGVVVGAIVLLLISFVVLLCAYFAWSVGQEYFVRKGR